MGSGTILHLPDEMLRELLKYLNGRDIINFSKVSLHWQSIVDDLGEEFWRRWCCREYPVIYEDSHRKSGMSWRDLYHSFSLWERVSEAEVRVTPCRYDNVNEFSFNFLKNFVISFPLKADNGFTDTVVYFDVKSHREIERTCYGFSFGNYIESDDVIALEISERSQRKVRIIPKVNENMSYDFEPQFSFANRRSWLLEGDEIFYIRLNKFCRIKIKIESKEVSYEHTELCDNKLTWMLAVAYIGEKIHVLGTLWGNTHNMSVVTIKNRKMQVIYNVSDYFTTDKEVFKIMNDLRGYGFRSHDPRILWKFIKSINSQYNEHVRASVLYGPHFLTGTIENGVKVYLNINNAVQKTFTANFGADNILLNLLEVIETVHGHIIVAICTKKLYIIDVTHNDCAAEIPTEIIGITEEESPKIKKGIT